MRMIRKSTILNAPAQRILEMLGTPAHIIEYPPGVIRTSGFQRTPQRVGDTRRITNSAMGLQVPIKFTTVTYGNNARCTLTFESELRGTTDWGLEGQGGGTRLNMVLDYTMRGGIRARTRTRL